MYTFDYKRPAAQADATSQIGQRGDCLAHDVRGGNLRMLGHGPDHHRAVVEMNTV